MAGTTSAQTVKGRKPIITPPKYPKDEYGTPTRKEMDQNAINNSYIAAGCCRNMLPLCMGATGMDPCRNTARRGKKTCAGHDMQEW